jgi:hypothetical protein
MAFILLPAHAPTHLQAASGQPNPNPILQTPVGSSGGRPAAAQRLCGLRRPVAPPLQAPGAPPSTLHPPGSRWQALHRPSQAASRSRAQAQAQQRLSERRAQQEARRLERRVVESATGGPQADPRLGDSGGPVGGGPPTDDTSVTGTTAATTEESSNVCCVFFQSMHMSDYLILVL